MTATFKNLSPTQTDAIVVGSVSTPPFPVREVKALIEGHTDQVVTALEVITERLGHICDAISLQVGPVVNLPAPIVQVIVPEQAPPSLSIQVPETSPAIPPAVSVTAKPGEVAIKAQLTLPGWLLAFVVVVFLVQMSAALALWLGATGMLSFPLSP